MTPERWRRVNALFHAALERAPADRDAYVREACAGDTALRDEVESLLASHARATDGRFIESPAFENDPDLLAPGQPESPLAGRTVGAYRVIREIGRGGMGIVYLAEDTRLGRTVALKALPESLAGEEDRRERLRREARAAAALSHPAVAVVYALEEIGGALFIASEYIEGRSLRDEIRQGPLALDAVAATAKALASGLAAAHARGIVHRDLKPENVIRARDGQVKILDFGLARVLADQDTPTTARITAAGAVMGTPGYMAPEQLEGRPVDARADVFAFGALVHELATGALPGQTRDSNARSSRAPRAVPPALDRIVRRCLLPDPAARFQNGAELLVALESGARSAGSAQARTAGSAHAPAATLRGTHAGSRRWWWQFHQLAIAVFHALLLAGVWTARDWLDRPWRTIALYAAVAAATADVTMRLNLWFASRIQPQTLADQRARLVRALLAVDAGYAFVLCALAAVGAGDHEAIAALLLTGAIVSLLSLLVIEPATARAAFGPRQLNRSSPQSR